MLVMSQIKDILVAVKSSNAHREKVDFFVKQQAFKSRGIKVRLVGLTDDAKSLGDVLRQVAENKLLKDDFVLVRADTVSNIDLRPAIQMHYQIKELQGRAENKAQIADLRKFRTIMTKMFIKMAHNNAL